jgi:release factor glutamine methyltransferase
LSQQSGRVMIPPAQPATFGQALRAARERLASSSDGAESPALDAEVLLRHVLGVERETLYANLSDTLRVDVAQEFDRLIARRAEGVPVAYLTGAREFYGRTFAVTPDVLVPRPETEFLVEWPVRRAIRWIGDRRHLVVDVGTGSGAIALSIAIELAGKHCVIGSDVSLPALGVARRNRERLAAPAALVAGSLLDWCRSPLDLVIANLPYLRPDQEHAGIRHEPRVALFAGTDGFALSRGLIRQAAGLLAGDGALIMEIDPAQRELALNAARDHFPTASTTVKPDLAGLDRYLIVDRAAPR